MADNYFPKGPHRAPKLPSAPQYDSDEGGTPKSSNKPTRKTVDAFNPFVEETPRVSNTRGGFSVEDNTPRITNAASMTHRQVSDETPRISNASQTNPRPNSIPTVPEFGKQQPESAVSRAPPRTRSSRRALRTSSGISVGGNSTASSHRRTLPGVQAQRSGGEGELSRKLSRTSHRHPSRRRNADDVSLPTTASAPVISSTARIKRSDASTLSSGKKNSKQKIIEGDEGDNTSIQSAPEPGAKRKKKTPTAVESGGAESDTQATIGKTRKQASKKMVKKKSASAAVAGAGAGAGAAVALSHDTNGDIEAGMSTPPSKTSKKSRGTPSTVASTPGVKSTATEDGNKVTIAHTFTQSGGGAGRNAGKILGMSKPVAAILGLVMFSTMGVGLFGWLEAFNLKDQIEELEQQIDRLTVEVDRLSGEVDRLESENDRYEVLNDKLNSTVIELQAVNEDLEETAFELETSVNSLNSTVIDLRSINTDLREENEQYQRLNDQLVQIVSFLNETADTINQSFEQITEFLSDQIVLNRQIAIRTLELQYQDQASFWDCTLSDVFQGESWINNQNAPVGTAGISRVLNYVEERVLSELCLNRSDFNLFLVSRFGSLSSVSVNQLRQSVALYTDQALDYYFPDAGETGLTSIDWAEASYTCEGVDDFELFA